MDYLDILLRLFAAMAFGLLLGLERVYAHKTAGMRTYALVSLSAALFIVLGERIGLSYGNISSDSLLRVAAGVITGIGFLGAGLIIFKDNHVANLTTAAGLWVAAGIGLAAGLGFYVEAAMATFLTIFILHVLGRMEHRLKTKIGPAEGEKEKR